MYEACQCVALCLTQFEQLSSFKHFCNAFSNEETGDDDPWSALLVFRLLILRKVTEHELTQAYR